MNLLTHGTYMVIIDMVKTTVGYVLVSKGDKRGYNE